MIKKLDQEIDNYLKDIEEIISDKEISEKLLNRSNEFIKSVLIEYENALKFKEKEIDEIKEKQRITDEKFEELNRKFENMYSDIYDEYEEFDILCPYCNNEFNAEIDYNNQEITCPECNNIIELDWSGDPDSEVIDDNEQGCSGNCSHCGECGNE